MPLNDCQSEGLPGVKWGEAGKCYTYQPGDEAGREAAVAKALAQAVAIGDLPADEAASAAPDEVRAPDVDLTPTEAVAVAARKVRELDRAEDDKQQADTAGKETDMATRDEGASWMTARQRALADKLHKIADTFGPWDGGIGANGAHYIPAADNAWVDDGLACARCAFYRGGGGCEIVGQQVEPEGVCRFWIVPDPDAPAEDMPAMDDEDMGEDAPPPAVAIPSDEAAPMDTDALRVERALSPGRVEWRESGAGPDYRTVVGYAAVWDSMSEDLGGFREVIKRGAFADALASGDEVRFVLGHDMDTVMARTSNGSLELVEDEVGLRMWARIALDDPDAQRLDAKLRSGAMSQMSFAFTMPADGKGEKWDYSGGVPVRSVERVQMIYEVSAVGSPAYTATAIAARAGILEDAISSGRLPEAGATAAAPGSPVDGTPQAARLGTDDNATRKAAAKWAGRLARIRKEVD